MKKRSLLGFESCRRQHETWHMQVRILNVEQRDRDQVGFAMKNFVSSLTGQSQAWRRGSARAAKSLHLLSANSFRRGSANSASLVHRPATRYQDSRPIGSTDLTLRIWVLQIDSPSAVARSRIDCVVMSWRFAKQRRCFIEAFSVADAE